MNILYLPIHQSGTYHAKSLANKKTLHDALAKVGHVREMDYVAIPPERLDEIMLEQIGILRPDLLWLQFQGATSQTAGMVKRWRALHPAMAVVNWNGDVYEEHLISPDMLAFLCEIDLQLVVNASVLDYYQTAGIRALFCPFGFEEPSRMELTMMPEYDVLFCGNNYSDKRLALYEILRSLPFKVGIYGIGWPASDGDCNYEFDTATALYRRATIVISDNQFPNAKGYLSDRPIQALSAGAFVLQQQVAGLHELTGLTVGLHYETFTLLDELPGMVGYWMKHEEERQQIARQGQQFVLVNHTWDKRVEMVLRELEKVGHYVA